MVHFEDGGGRDSLAPVIPLFGERAAATVRSTAEPSADADTEAAARWHPTWTREHAAPHATADEDDRADESTALAEKVLLKRLRTRSLSVAEARALLLEHDLDDAAAERVLASTAAYGYLDDGALAEQLVHAGIDRKGQGRQAISQTLVKRGIPRDVAEAALAALPDDDFERALEYATNKARAMRGLDHDTALRRLTGQLARRGYGGSVAMSAARAALGPGSGGPAQTRGVRFE
jgi:regulatory protein